MDNFPRANYTEKDLESIMKRVYNGKSRFAKRASYDEPMTVDYLDSIGLTVGQWNDILEVVEGFLDDYETWQIARGIDNPYHPIYEDFMEMAIDLRNMYVPEVFGLVSDVVYDRINGFGIEHSRVKDAHTNSPERASRTANTQAWNILRYFGKPTVKAWAKGDPNGYAVASQLEDIDFDGSVAKALREAIGYQAKSRFSANRKNAYYDPMSDSTTPMSQSELASEAEAVFDIVFDEDPNALLQSGAYGKIFDHFKRYGISNDYNDAVSMANYIEKNLLKHSHRANRKNTL